jgi:hypothetical protein
LQALNNLDGDRMGWLVSHVQFTIYDLRGDLAKQKMPQQPFADCRRRGNEAQIGSHYFSAS